MKRDRTTLQEYCLEAVRLLGEDARCLFCCPGYGVVIYRGREFVLNGPTVRGWHNLNRGLLSLDIYRFKQQVNDQTDARETIQKGICLECGSCLPVPNLTNAFDGKVIESPFCSDCRRAIREEIGRKTAT